MVDMMDIERYLEASFITVLREVFAHSSDMTYSDKDEETMIFISSTFPEKDSENKVPQLIVGGVSYGGSASSLFNNYYSGIMEAGIKRGNEYRTRIPFQLSITCLSPEDGEAKDLSNALFNTFFLELKDVILDVFKIQIKNIQKNPGSGLAKALPKNVFSQTISISGDVSWKGTIKKNNLVLNAIKTSVYAKSSED